MLNPGSAERPWFPSMAQVQRAYCLAVIAMFNGNKTQAARELGVDRRTLYRWIHSWEVERRNMPEEPETVGDIAAARFFRCLTVGTIGGQGEGVSK